MGDGRLWQEAAESCISVMVFYHDARKSPEVDRWMADELRTIGSLIGAKGVSPGAAGRWIIRPVQDGLIVRFGHQVGPGLVSIFARTLGATEPPPPAAM